VRVTQPGAKADPEKDDVRVDGRRVETAVEHVYIALNKPEGYVTTVSDPHAERTVMDLVRGVPQRIYPVGRLDADSAGLLLMTNDGAFTERLTHPRHQVPKTYRAVVRGEVPAWAAVDLRKGVLLEDGMTAPAQVEFVDYDPRHNVTVIDITIHEGRNRQVRRMFEAVGFPVLALTRTQVGPIPLKGLAPGTWRKLRPAEVEALLAAADAAPPALPQTPADDVEESMGTREYGRMGVKTPAPPHSHTPKRPDTEHRAAAQALTERLRADRTPGETPAKRAEGGRPT